MHAGLALVLLGVVGMFTRRRGQNASAPPPPPPPPPSRLGGLDPLGDLIAQRGANVLTSLGSLGAQPQGGTTTASVPATTTPAGGAAAPPPLPPAAGGAAAPPPPPPPPAARPTTTTTSTTRNPPRTLGPANNSSASPAQVTAARQLAEYLAMTARPDPARVREYQRAMGGVAVDGIVGPQTRDRMAFLGVAGVRSAQTAAANPAATGAVLAPGATAQPTPTQQFRTAAAGVGPGTFGPWQSGGAAGTQRT